MAAKRGDQTLEAGLQHQREFLKGLGVTVETISFSSGAGDGSADAVTPRAAVKLLEAMLQRPEADAYFDGLPVLGVDRFTTPGDRPFAVHDLGGLRVGMSICYDGSFPETARVLMLLGADLVVLATNWPTGALSTVKYLVQPRALENQVYYAACNRVGQERGFYFIGRSRIVNVNGELLTSSEDDSPTILYADIDPAQARNKHIVKIPKIYELHRTADRRPELYGPLCTRQA